MNAAEDILVQVDGLHCGYGAGDVVRDVSLHVCNAEIACLIGPNGAGKSTIIKAIVGLIRVRAGSVRFAGADITREGVSSRVERGIALVPEGRGVLATLSVEDNLLMGGYVRRRETWMTERLEEMYALFPVLAQRRTQTAGTLSGGEQQMLVIGRALMSRPRLLILDEPSFGLAPKMIASIFDTIAGLRRAGFSILLVEQNATIALEISQRGYVIDAGRCVLAADTAALRANRLVQDIYLGVA